MDNFTFTVGKNVLLLSSKRTCVCREIRTNKTATLFGKREKKLAVIIARVAGVGVKVVSGFAL